MIKNKIPKHVAVIPDGNRRWAKNKGLEGVKGHEKSAEVSHITKLLKEAEALSIEYVSFWGFSTENWKRSKYEKNFLFKILEKTIEGLRDYAKKNKIRFKHIGRKDRLPKKLITIFENLENQTKNNKGLKVQFFLDYGGKDEIIRAVKNIIKSGSEEISEEIFSEYLDTKNIPEPDMIIRTGGEYRLSGFMPYQGTYSELYFTDTFFPNFGPKGLRKAVKEFSRRKRTYGGD